MSKITKPLRGNRATKRLDMSDLRELLKDRRIWTALALVTEPDNGPHFQVIPGEGGNPTDVLVHVATVPDGLDLTCRLGTTADGLWRIPPVGREVAVLVAAGHIDFMPVIVATIGDPPARVAGDRTLLGAPDRLEMVAPDVRIGDGDATEAVVLGTGYRSAEDTMLTALKTALGLLVTASGSAPFTPLTTGFTDAVAAITAFQTSASGAQSFLSQIVKAK